jgi:hypothetical protein
MKEREETKERNKENKELDLKKQRENGRRAENRGWI